MRGSFESHVVSTFRHHSRVPLNPIDNLNYPIILKKHVGSLVITATHCRLRTEENIWKSDRPKINNVLVLENLNTDRLMSLVRRLVIQSDFKILVAEGDQL